uniref:Uncharacterized protein n=1 Tax=Rhinopithecus bieti TaxID=61621 RepID=A0A2K6LL92_RHIBE
MEELLKRELGCGSVKATGHSGGGCISQGRSYDTDRGRVFVKVNPKAEVRPRPRSVHCETGRRGCPQASCCTLPRPGMLWPPVRIILWPGAVAHA